MDTYFMSILGTYENLIYIHYTLMHFNENFRFPITIHVLLLSLHVFYVGSKVVTHFVGNIYLRLGITDTED